MLPHALTQLSGFASLNKDYLLPHDTINAVVRAGSHFHGTVVLTFASPTKSRPVQDGFVITGTDGWLSVNQVTPAGSNTPVLRVTIKSVVKKDGEPDEEREEITEEPMRGVQLELGSFFDAVSGNHDTLALGDPLGALRDVSFIQAALNSEGNLVDLTQLVPASL
jgi:predicted dehydrogenase